MYLTVTVTRTKTCRKCNIEKALGEFPLDPQHADGHKAQCKACYYDNRKRRRIYIKYAKRGTSLPMMSDEFFQNVYKNPTLREYIKNLAYQRSRGNEVLCSDMVQAAWVRIAHLREGVDLDTMERAATRAIDAERWKHWAQWYHEGLTFDELLSHEEWSMWSSGCID